MGNYKVVTIDNTAAGSIELAPAIFEAKVKPDLLHAEVRRQLASRHAGTHSTKNRHAVSGGGAKPWRQKGTGRARQGTTRAAQWAGGGVVFGPVPRSYVHSLPRKVRAAALRSAISLRFQEDAVTILEDFPLEGYKTRRVVEILGSLGLSEESVLIVLAEADARVERSARNIPRVDVIRSIGLNVYDVLRHTRLLVTRAAIEALGERLQFKGRRQIREEPVS